MKETGSLVCPFLKEGFFGPFTKKGKSEEKPNPVSIEIFPCGEIRLRKEKGVASKMGKGNVRRKGVRTSKA